MALSLLDTGLVVWLTGLSGAGKTTIADALKARCTGKNISCVNLDGDLLRTGLCSDLGFSIEDRKENIRRVTEVASVLRRCGHLVIVSLISPLESAREEARKIIGAEHFIETYINTPLEVCEERDPKGLYKKVRAGEIPNFTGIDSPYEAPKNPDVSLETASQSVEESVAQLVGAVTEKINIQL